MISWKLNLLHILFTCTICQSKKCWVVLVWVFFWGVFFIFFGGGVECVCVCECACVRKCYISMELTTSIMHITVNTVPVHVLREGKVLFNDTHKTLYLQLCGVTNMVKDHSDSERGNPPPPHGQLFLSSSKGSFICIIKQTG